MNSTVSKPSMANSIFSIGLVIALYVVLSSSLSLWQESGPRLISSMRMGLCVSFLVMVIAWALNRLNFKTLRLDPLSFSYGLLIFFFSDWFTRGYNLLQGPSIRGEILLGATIGYVTLRKGATSKLWILLPLFIVMLGASFFYESSGAQLFSDDHATFFYRLTLLKENFPDIPFYGPLWNAGIDVRDFFATGALSVYFLFYALIQFFPVENIYNVMIAIMLFLLAPGAAFVAARLEKLSAKEASLAAILALVSSLLWYRWALKYGTLGFVISTILTPLNLSLAIRVISRDVVIELWQAVLLVLSFSLMLFWTPAGLVFIPIAVIALFRARMILRKRYAAVILLAVLAFNLPWVFTFWSVSKVGSFVSAEKASHENLQSDGKLSEAQSFRHKAQGFNPKKSLQILREAAISANPILLVLLMPGLLLVPGRTRAPLSLTILWLLLLGTVIPTFKPQFEFDRMLVILGFCGVVPSAYALRHLFENFDRSLAAKWSGSLAVGLLFASGFSVAGVIRNRSVERYYFAPPLLGQISQAITTYAGEGRVLFSGFVLHELGQGHLAPLTYFTKLPLMASSHVHNLWKYRQIFPEEYIARGEAGIEEYLNLYNVSAVFAHEREWREYFSSRPEKFKLVWNAERFSLFQRINYASNYFYEGAGQVLAQTSNKVVLRPSTSEVTIKFNYFPFLKSSACRISSREVSEHVTLIRLTDCPTSGQVVIESQGVLARILRGVT